eukprot:gene10868-13801_t
MVVLGLILLIIGLIAKISILTTIGAILLVVGLILNLVPVGGTHLTNDLSIGLRLTDGQAEKLKLRFGRASVQTKDKAAKVMLDGNFAIGDRQFSQQAIEQITAARTWELLEVVKKKLGNAFTPETCVAGV